MTRQLLIYERAVPVSAQRHGDWSVKTGGDYAFARKVNSIPLMAVEFPGAATEYAIVFAGSGDEVMPAIILGMKEEQNLYVDDAGQWQAKYVPAFLRRYPFVFSKSDDGQTFTLCIDEEFSGCNQDGRGERLFDADGERTQYTENILNFLKEYQAHFLRTKAFCQKLKEMDLLEPMRAQITLNTGQRLGLEGFMALDRGKLKALSGDQLAALAKTDELELVYLHLQSMRNFRAMVERIAPGSVPPADVAADAAAEGDAAPPKKTAAKGKKKS